MFYYILVVSGLLGLYLFYIQMASFRWSEEDRRRLQRLNLGLANLIPLIDAPDVQLLLQRRHSRRLLFLKLSTSLRKDVLTLLRIRALSFTAVGLIGLFFLSYYLMRLKANVFSSRRDLRFLVGIGLGIYRKSSPA